MNIFDIYIRSPINRTAATITSNRNCDHDYLLSMDDVRHIMKLLVKKRKRLSAYLGLDTRAKVENLGYKLSKGKSPNYKGNEPRIVMEWRRTGLDIQRFTNRLVELKKESGI
jgi:hypothetical protein